MFDEEGFDALTDEDKTDVIQLLQLLNTKIFMSHGVTNLPVSYDTRTEEDVFATASKYTLDYWGRYLLDISKSTSIISL